MGDTQNVCKILDKSLNGMAHLEDLHTEYNITTDLKKMEDESMYLIHLAQDRDQGEAVVNTVMNPRCLLSFYPPPFPTELVTSFHNATVTSLRRLRR